MVAMLDHPQNVRHPVTWFARKNLLGAGLLMEGDLEIERGDSLKLRYGLGIFDEAVGERWLKGCTRSMWVGNRGFTSVGDG